ncbi:MAG TPA: hypothetical protein VGE06_05860, partial [Flavisolibacter sp.]
MKNRITLFFFTLCFAFTAGAQVDITKIDKKAVTLYEQALVLIDAGKYRDALVVLQQAINRDDQ